MHTFFYIFIILREVYFALPCLGPLAPRGAVGARHDGLPRQFSPLLPVVCHGLRLSEGFAGPLCDVITPALFRPSHFFDCLRLFPVVLLWIGRPILSRAQLPIPFQFTPLYSCQEIFVRSNMLYDGFPHMVVCDSVFVGDAKYLSEASKL